jgi:hypothetical protein
MFNPEDIIYLTALGDLLYLRHNPLRYLSMAQYPETYITLVTTCPGPVTILASEHDTSDTQSVRLLLSSNNVRYDFRVDI